MTSTELAFNEKKIVELKYSISKLESSLSVKLINLNFLIHPKIHKIKTQITMLDFIQETNVMNFLEENDKEYLALTNMNFDLLTNNKVEFKNYEEEGGMFSSHANKMKGFIHNNGFVYTDTTETNFAPLNIQKGFYPLEYEGMINYLGELEVWITKTGYVLIGGRVPQKFKGFIDSNGNIKLVTDETEWQTAGGFYVNKMVGDIFVDEHDKRTQFLENIHLLKNKIKEQREIFKV